MICTIHQPEHLPWLGFWEKVLSAEVFVILDHVQFKRRHFECRNKIRNTNNDFWITVETQPCPQNTPVNKVLIGKSEIWKSNNLKRVKESYRGSRFFESIYPQFEQIYNSDFTHLVELNISLINWVLSLLGHSPKVILSSQLMLNSQGSDLILEICKQVGARTYYSGASGRDYLDLAHFKHDDINVIFQSFHHPLYHQMGKEFIPNLSILDFLMNNSPDFLKQEFFKIRNHNEYSLS